ncbi:MAG: hypothetical protein CEN90_53 [Parcubacteria group bacterium Licking1014_17]|nr:MAG: hypothetical protein CEN90_53 [Parcubacteria group bacterium Licking1014_17]
MKYLKTILIFLVLSLLLLPPAAAGKKKESKQLPTPPNYNIEKLNQIDLEKESWKKVGAPGISLIRVEMPERNYLPELVDKYRGDWDIFIFPQGNFGLDTGFIGHWLNQMGCGSDNYGFNNMNYWRGNQSNSRGVMPLQLYVLGELSRAFRNSSGYRLTNSEQSPAFILKSCIGISGSRYEGKSASGNNEITALADSIVGTRYKNKKIRNDIFNVVRGAQKKKGQYLVSFFINMWFEDPNGNVVLGSSGFATGVAQSCQRVRMPWGTEKVEGIQNTLLSEVVFEAVQQAINNLRPASLEEIK